MQPVHLARRLYRPDLPLFRDHLVRLDAETRYNRFGLHVSDTYLTDYAELCFRPGALTYGSFSDGVVRGAAELRFYPSQAVPGRRDAEAAFSVETLWRRQGIGTELMAEVVLAARNRDVATLTIVCLRHNRAMLALARKFEADLSFEMNDVTGHLVARPPSAVSVWHEFLDNALDLGTAVVDYQSRFLRATARQFGPPP